MKDIYNVALCSNCIHKNNVFCDKRHSIHDNSINKPTSRKYSKGEVIFKQGVHPTGIHVIQSGKVKIIKTNEDGKEQIVRFAKSGELLGYRSLLGNHVYKGSAIALKDITICHIPERSFHEILSINPKLYVQLLEILSNDLARAEETIISIAQKTVKQRIAEAIVLLYFKFGCDGSNVIDVQISRKELGNIAGTTIETTIRTLSTLKKENLIDFDGKGIIVKDISQLMTMAHYNK